jgi:hypothetical protein
VKIRVEGITDDLWVRSETIPNTGRQFNLSITDFPQSNGLYEVTSVTDNCASFSWVSKEFDLNCLLLTAEKTRQKFSPVLLAD